METLEKKQVKKDVLIKSLNEFLADMQIFYQNLRGFHWNIKGSQFFVLHEKFEEYYTNAADQVDEIAERILAIGGEPLHSFTDYLAVATLTEVKNVSDGRKAVGHIIEQSSALLEKMKKIQQEAADQNDEGTDSMFSDMIGETEKKLWMLHSFLS